MATKIYNSDLTRSIVEATRLQSGVDSIPSELADRVIATIETNPKLLRDTTLIKNTSISTTGNQTIFTSSATRDTFITGILLTATKDATCDVAIGQSFASIFTTINGATTTLAAFSGLTLTAQDKEIFIDFDKPLKIDKNVAVSIGGGAYTVGLNARAATIYGYEIINVGA